MHLNDEHNGDPDDGADDHEPAQNHGPGGVRVVLVRHHLPLVETQTQDSLHRPTKAASGCLNVRTSTNNQLWLPDS